ncbi:MAG: hypothetical protein AAF467_25850 [Actinomycetota bacterium]
MARSAALTELHERLAPVTLSRDQLLDVPEPLAPLFPFGGLQKGQTVAFMGPGCWSVALALAGSAMGVDGWMAVVGVEELGLIAAAELGVRLDRVLLVETVPPAQLGQVLAALVEHVGIVAYASQRPLPPRDARRLTARARERSAVLLDLGLGSGRGAGAKSAADLTLATEAEEWAGIGEGHGYLRQRRLTITATGRRASARPRRTTVLLPGPDGAIAVVPSEPQVEISRHEQTAEERPRLQVVR